MAASRWIHLENRDNEDPDQVVPRRRGHHGHEYGLIAALIAVVIVTAVNDGRRQVEQHLQQRCWQPVIATV
ncbi:MAG TPA: Flp family type IVb pilin [Stellaceae bacterium]|nr:Flp family type IVb pilin [Stellaceae bacterium]